jgi:integrase
VDDWYVGFAVLNACRAGTYKPGDEILMAESLDTEGPPELEKLADRILRDYGQWHASSQVEERMTFAQVYEGFFKWKFGESAPKKLSESRKTVIKAAYNNLAPLHDRVFADLRVDDLQAVINACTLARGSLEKMKSLLTEMYKWAEARELCDKDYSKHLIIPSGAKEDEHGIPFTTEDLKKLWDHRDDSDAAFVLIMCYTGFRVSAYKTMEVNLEEMYFKGGLKTAAGKDRMVPIHPCIQDLVEDRISRWGQLLGKSVNAFRNRMNKLLDKLGIEEHTPHDCRHTFSALCERYGVSDADRKRMMGHSFGTDITNGIYGHRTIDDLRGEIVKIPSPQDL